MLQSLLKRALYLLSIYMGFAAHGAFQDILLSHTDNQSILRYHDDNASFSDFVTSGAGGLVFPQGLAFGPDNNLYVCDGSSNAIRRYNGTDGAYINTFVAPSSGGLVNPVALQFHGGFLYVLSGIGTSPKILRYNSTSGAFVSVAVAALTNQMASPKDFVIMPNGDFLVVSNTNSGARFSGSPDISGNTGAFLGHFLNPTRSSSILNIPTGITYGPDGNIYVSSFSANKITRFDPLSGDFISDFVVNNSLNQPTKIGFYNGHLYVANRGDSKVILYDATNGAYVREIVAPEPEGLSNLRHFTFALPIVNNPPVADAGDNKTVTEGTSVQLDGSQSSDPESGTLTYSWTQVGGPAVTLSSSTASQPTFLAPMVGTLGELLVFELIVNDGENFSAASQVSIDVNNLNHAPVADAGIFPAAVNEGSPITLNATGSSDPDGDTLSYSWFQTGGPTVTLSNSTSSQASFIAPQVMSVGAYLSFEVTVSDGDLSSTDTVQIIIQNQNLNPIARAGEDLSVFEGTSVSLNGLLSTDEDNSTLSYLWIQVEGPSVTLSGSNTAEPSFEAPLVNSLGTTLRFQLVVNDGTLSSAPDEVVVVVNDLSSPNAPLANAGRDRSFISGHLAALDGSQSQDPDMDSLTYEWTQISGSPVTLNNPQSVNPNFTAPTVLAGEIGETFSFKLVVSDGFNSSRPDIVNIHIKKTNLQPVALVEKGTQYIGLAKPVILDGSRSYDANGDDLTYEWVQRSGPAVSIANSTSAVASFTSPSDVGPGAAALATLRFELRVRDSSGSLSRAAKAVVVVTNKNIKPTTVVTRNVIVVQEGETVQLDASPSFDPNGNPLTFIWKQSVRTPKPPVLVGATGPTPSFVAPQVNGAPLLLRFSVQAKDASLLGLSQTVQVLILDSQNNVSCLLAAASIKRMWPINHALQAVDIRDFASDSNQNTELTINSVQQDEPTAGLKSGDTAVDALISDEVLYLRAERQMSRIGNSLANGRVYFVNFSARDTQTNATCTGTVKVNAGSGFSRDASDSKLRFNSFQ